MSILLTFTNLLFFIWVFRNILFWVHLWQLKEYRTDRLLVHLRETIQGKQLFFSPLLFLSIGAILSYAFIIADHNLLPFFQILVSFIFLAKAIVAGKEFFLHALRRPVFTPKAIFILVAACFFTFLLYSFPPVDKYLWILLLDKFIPLGVSLLVLLFSVPTEFYRDLKIEKAIKKMKNVRLQNKKLLVIGITGSYGKSSTKDYTAQILEKQFRVLKTQGTQNTPTGIANTVISGLKNTTEVFVVEMGAYRKGEIAEICQIVSPHIGVLTGVGDQHLSLFGSQENIMSAKYELIDSLPKNGLAVFNGNNKNAWELYNRTKKRRVLYQWGEKLQDLENTLPSDFKNSIYAYNISVNKTFVAFDVIVRSKTLHLKAYVIGGHTVENILPGIYIAYHLGMNEAQIKKAVLSLKGLPKTMELYKIPNGPSVIDDTFNANPVAITAVLNYIKLYKGKKILVLHPMIELGRNASEEHYLVGRQVSKVCDYIFLTNKNFSKNILQGIKDAEGKCKIRVSSATDAAQFITSNTGKDDIIAFEGKEANNVLQKVL